MGDTPVPGARMMRFVYDGWGLGAPGERSTEGRRAILVVATMLALLAVGGVALAATIEGTNGNDRIVGSDGRDQIAGKGGHDTIYGLTAVCVSIEPPVP